jgi:hypothetical protein
VFDLLGKNHALNPFKANSQGSSADDKSAYSG